MSEELRIKKRGEDGHRNLSIRIREETIKELDRIAMESNRSRNEIIKIMLEFGIKNCVIEDK